MRWAILTALVFLSGCVPMAVLQPPEPLRGERFTLGGSLFFPPVNSPYPVWGLPYVSYALGDGEREVGLTVQTSPRLGVKVRLAEGLSLEGGITLWLDPNQMALAGLSGDAGLLLRLGGGFYLSPRLHRLPWGAWASQVTLGYWGPSLALEGGYGPMGPYLAFGFYFETSPGGP